jgi:hypothetical protein
MSQESGVWSPQMPGFWELKTPDSRLQTPESQLLTYDYYHPNRAILFNPLNAAAL